MDHLLLGFVGGRKIMSITSCNGDGLGFLNIDSQQFTVADAQDDLFYDWFMNADDEIAGLELHADRSEQIYQYAEQHGLVDSTVSPFPRWPLCHSPQGRELGLEAFGDLRLLSSPRGDHLLIVPVDGWLTGKQAASVRRCVRDQE